METVHEFTISVGVLIRREPCGDYERDYFPDGYRYDWISDRGESDEVFGSESEAIKDAYAMVGDR